MITGVKELLVKRYEPWTLLRAGLHSLGSAYIVVCSYQIFGPYTWIIPFVLPVIIELVQLVKDGELKLLDRILDALEWCLGGCIGLSVFLLVRLICGL